MWSVPPLFGSAVSFLPGSDPFPCSTSSFLPWVPGSDSFSCSVVSCLPSLSRPHIQQQVFYQMYTRQLLERQGSGTGLC